MPRKMKAAPPNVSLLKTTRNTWIAFREIWDGDILVDVHAMRLDDAQNSIAQESERRRMLEVAERAMLQTKLREEENKRREAERELQQLKRAARGASGSVNGSASGGVSASTRAG